MQFHWDRYGKGDETSSCWIRVSSTWAGKGWGQISIPRIGQEVIVDFLEGDPDRPIIVGRVYNAESMPPYTLPDEQTKSTIKTNSSKGSGGFNEIRFEDKKGDEQLFIHAEKDTDFRVKNDQREWIGRDTHLIVKRDRIELVERDEQLIVKRDLIENMKRDHHLEVGGKQAIKIAQSHSLDIGTNAALKIGGNLSEVATGNVYLKGQAVVIEGMSGLTLKVGGNFITLSPAGVMIQGTLVMINSGGAALPGMAGMLVSPSAPKEAEEADKAEPGAKDEHKRAGSPPSGAGAGAGAGAGGTGNENAPTHDPNSEENKEKTHFIEIEFVDEAGQPVAGEAYEVKLPDGSIASGTTDEKGKAKITNIDAGNCEITFPNLDQEAWEE
ncbi:MAG: type VI secretion system tip protein TssI/VgrG [Blastocatellia bacterium]